MDDTQITTQCGRYCPARARRATISDCCRRYPVRVLQIVVLLIGTLLPAVSSAQGSTAGYRIQQFEPADGKTNYITVYGSRVLSHLEVSGALYVNYADDPLRAVRGREVLSNVIEHQLALDAMVAVGFFDTFELALALPVTLLQESGDLEFIGRSTGDELAGIGVGDLRLVPRVRILNNTHALGPGLAFQVALGVPSGASADFMGDGRVSLEPRVVFDWRFGPRASLGVNVGVLLRESASISNIEVGNELTFGLAGEVPLYDEYVTLVLESFGSAVLTGSSIDSEEVPLELLGAMRYYIADLFTISLGGGAGLINGYGTPDFRLFVGFAYAPPLVKPGDDPDGDGIIADADHCPLEPEDVDTWKDDDGCPDLDNDGDGIADKDDACPLKAEDYDGWEDENGCPDPDNDNDRIVDADDGCPNQPEDHDGWQDKDGCPDPDNDEDGIADSYDSCPDEPEDYDQWQDENGCPDPDNDDDGIADVDDRCPNEPENVNGVQDQDGCPDQEKVQVTGEKIVIYDKVYFEFDSDVIKPQSFAILDQVVAVLDEVSDIKKVKIVGHTSSEGSAKYNLKLSKKRARSVMRYLIAHGIAAERLAYEGRGEQEPIADNMTDEGREINRRVEFLILERGE